MASPMRVKRLLTVAKLAPPNTTFPRAEEVDEICDIGVWEIEQTREKPIFRQSDKSAPAAKGQPSLAEIAGEHEAR